MRSGRLPPGQCVCGEVPDELEWHDADARDAIASSGASMWLRSIGKRAAWAVLTAAILAAGLAGCGTRPPSGARQPAARLVTPPPPILAPAPSPPTGVTGLRLVGARRDRVGADRDHLVGY